MLRVILEEETQEIARGRGVVREERPKVMATPPRCDISL
jgi:hypothetical protein